MTTQSLSALTMLLYRHTKRREFISHLGGAASVSRHKRGHRLLRRLLASPGAFGDLEDCDLCQRWLEACGDHRGMRGRILNKIRHLSPSAVRLLTATDSFSVYRRHAGALTWIYGKGVGGCQHYRLSRFVPIILSKEAATGLQYRILPE